MPFLPPFVFVVVLKQAPCFLCGYVPELEVKHLTLTRYEEMRDEIKQLKEDNKTQKETIAMLYIVLFGICGAVLFCAYPLSNGRF